MDEREISTLVKISRHYGSDPAIVLAGGGNTSVKSEDRLFVKASGHALSTIDVDGFVEMDRCKLADLAAADLGDDPEQRETLFKDAIYAARIAPEKGLRPSIECLLHHLIPGKFVVHTHATLANTLTCSETGQAIAADLFDDDFLWLPYVDPGFALAQTLQNSWSKGVPSGNTPRFILMENHGLIVMGDTAQELQATTDHILQSIAARLGADWQTAGFGQVSRLKDPQKTINVAGPALRGLLAESPALKTVTFDDSPVALSLTGGEIGRCAAGGGPLTPDQIVYCTSYPLWIETVPEEKTDTFVARLRTEIDQHIGQHHFPPKVILIQGVGLFTTGDDYRTANTVRQVYLDAIQVMGGAARLGGIKHLSDRERTFIENWEAESYRKQVSLASGGNGRATGKVAVITGAAQGFGLKIASLLTAAGAHVVLADLNEDGVRQAADALCQEHGPGRATGLSINVTDEESVVACLHQVVRTFGGLDLFISNAGVLKAESVKTQPKEDFEFVNSVNYSGYFLCTQKVAPILSTQHAARPDYRSDVIQINSKSGLVGSNRNFAYAGSKFGSIGLTQSFALELVEDGIKVNCICPGNYLNGPLWSDPKKGLFVQYLQAGKVPGAKTLDDVKRFYESKVPMGRGCQPKDVVAAILYLMDQQYETGQALPVTGGQVMLH
ncbi:MAG: hypothetical protein CMJ62_09345 [Planctomycetaceae bacterium]|nr:hypothetical protein [Planctomycetaceae bacterium]